MMDLPKYAELSKSIKPLRARNQVAAVEIGVQVLWLALGFFLSLHDVTWIVGQLLLGIAFWRSFAILHACGHNAFFRNRVLNHATGLFLSGFCFVPYFSWKYIHHDHHLWTGWKDLDPTTRNLERPLSPTVKTILNFCWKFWIPIISLHYIVTMFFDPRADSFKANQHKAAVVASIVLVLLFHASLGFLLGPGYVRTFALSTYIYLNMGDISLLTQHVHLPLDHSQGKKVKPKLYFDQDQYSHTMNLPAWVTKWVVLSFNHHALHHLFPQMPYYYSHTVPYQGQHTHDWREWIRKSKSMKASDLIHPV